MIGRRRSPMAGGVGPSAPPPVSGWRLLTVADFGPIVEGTAGQGITLTDSGDPLYPLRLTYTLTGAAVSNVCWPVIGTAKTVLDRQFIANPIIKARATTFPTGAGLSPYTGFAFGTFDGAIATAVGGGMWFQKWNPTTWRIGRLGLSGASTIVTTLGWMDFSSLNDASAANAIVLIRNPDNGTSQRQFVWTIADADIAGVGTDSVNAVPVFATALAAGTREWCLIARKGAPGDVSVTDLAFWIMDTPPPPPYIPQP